VLVGGSLPAKGEIAMEDVGNLAVADVVAWIGSRWKVLAATVKTDLGGLEARAAYWLMEQAAAMGARLNTVKADFRGIAPEMALVDTKLHVEGGSYESAFEAIRPKVSGVRSMVIAVAVMLTVVTFLGFQAAMRPAQPPAAPPEAAPVQAAPAVAEPLPADDDSAL